MFPFPSHIKGIFLFPALTSSAPRTPSTLLPSLLGANQLTSSHERRLASKQDVDRSNDPAATARI
jgi:hypothetical protein